MVILTHWWEVCEMGYLLQYIKGKRMFEVI